MIEPTNILLLALDADAFLPTVVAAGSIFALVYWVWRILQTGDLEQGNEWRFDVTRINDLRRRDSTFRAFQPIIQGFAQFNRGIFANSLPEIYREIQAAGLPRSWLPEEYLGKLQFIGSLLAPFVIYSCIYYMGPPGAILGVVISVLLVYLMRRNLTNKAQHRLKLIKRRMPFLLDLMTLLMEAGTTFIHALEQGVKEYRGHPISVEFSRVLTDMNLGKTRREAFEAMRDRLSDDEITSIISSMLQAEELGTPLAGIFRTQSDVMRLKRSQRAEAIAGEAGVKMLLPGVMVMAATVIIIIGPFALNFLIFGFSME